MYYHVFQAKGPLQITSLTKIRRYQNKIDNQNTVCSYTGLHGRCYDPNQMSNYDGPHVKKHYRHARLPRLKKEKDKENAPIKGQYSGKT
ncbi:hypothetical protein RR48_01568 [Papilio machaon]|uniref:Uncharacterized protein n=1 Tax=Papilio machaon TaxID=76193 RepID=A0A0N1IPX1_PAPMA|nr:hypothetical protein RR48_01568 [Papilio machaon]